VVDYAVNLTRATRPVDGTAPALVKNYLTWGAGPRAAQYLILGAKSRALLHGRFNVSSDDVRAMAKPVLRHRIYTNFNADAEGLSPDNIVELLVQRVPEPKVEDYRAGKGARPKVAPPAAPAAAKRAEVMPTAQPVPKGEAPAEEIPTARPVSGSGGKLDNIPVAKPADDEGENASEAEQA